MVELEEIRIGNNEITLNNNLVKTSILPQTTKELSRNIKIQSNVIFEGSVFGNCINIEGGNVTFEGAVYANNELYVNSRTEGFNLLTKEVILYGSDVLSKNRYEDCYGKALKVRRVVAEKFEDLMKTYDAVLAPACSKSEYVTYDINDAFMTVYKESVFTALANLIGTPSLVSGGVQLMGKYFNEAALLSLAGSVERAGE